MIRLSNKPISIGHLFLNREIHKLYVSDPYLMVKAMLSCQTSLNAIQKWNLGNFSRPCFSWWWRTTKRAKVSRLGHVVYFSQVTRCIYVIYEYGWFGTGLWLKTRSRHTIWTPTHFWPLKSKVLFVCHRLLSKCVHGCFQHRCYDFCRDLHVCWLHTHVFW